MKITLTQDGKILRNGQYVGFIEDEKAYVIARDRQHCLGWFDHRVEVAGMVEKYFNDRQNS